MRNNKPPDKIDPDQYLIHLLEDSRLWDGDQQGDGESESLVQDLDPLTDQKIKDSKQDRNLKKIYATYFIWILIFQLVAMNAIFILVGCKVLTFGDLVLDVYITGTLAQVFGVVLVITKNLFPIKKDKL